MATPSSKSAIRILCVDRCGDGRSEFAQAYLELLRIWFAKEQKDLRDSDRTWLFRDVSSAVCYSPPGFGLPPPSLFPRSWFGPSNLSQIRQNLALDAYYSEGTLQSSEDQAVISRVATRMIRGLKIEDFQKDFIVCFDTQTLRWLEYLKSVATFAAGCRQKALICLVRIRTDLDWNKIAMADARSQLRFFASSYLGWKVVQYHASQGYWGIKQILIPNAGLQAIRRHNDKVLAGLKKNTACIFCFSSETEEGMRLVSIIGKEEKVHEAATKIWRAGRA